MRALAAVMGLCWAGSLAAQSPESFADLSLAQLLDTKVVPTNVLGAHTHFGGEFMVGYELGFMDMHGNRSGTRAVEDDAVLEGYMVAPTEMHMEMHMLQAMYGVSDRVTVMVMAPFRRLSMHHLTRIGSEFASESAGLGDLMLRARATILGAPGGRHRLLLESGVTLPTGSVNARGDTPAGANQRLPYPMQPGAGTVSVGPGLTYLGEAARLAWEVQASGQFFPWDNSVGYAPGRRLRANAAVLWAATSAVSPLFRLTFEDWADYRGADPGLDPMMVPTADPARRAGQRTDLALGVQLYWDHGWFREQRVAAEVAAPVHQSLNGPQLSTAWRIRIKLTRTF